MAKSYLLLLLKFLMILLGVVWVSIWFLKPTQIWTRKWKEAEEAARSTVFGSSGLGFVVYSFPIIVFVMIGLVYLHFKPQEERGRGRRGRWVSNPIIVNGFIGVVSGMEVVVIMIFILFLGWTLYIRLSNDYNKMMPLPGKSLNRWQYMTFRTATRCGLLAEACLGLLLFPVTRGMNVFRLFGIQFEASVRYHIWLGNFMLFFATLHGVGTLFIWGIQNMLQHQMVQWQKSGRIYLAGEITLVTGLVIWITSLPQVRRKRFEIFYYTHHLYIIFIIFFLFHTGDRHFFLVLPTIFIFVIERLLRIIESTPQTCILSARIFPSKAIQLILPKEPGLKYTPRSIILIKIPSISRFQWHSFSLASSSMVDDDTMSIIIKCDGTWTNSLFHIIQHQTTIPVSVQGPYGPPSTQFIRAEIIAEEMARKRILEAEVRNELMMEREMAMRNAGEFASPITSQPLPASHKNLFMSEILHRQSIVPEEKLVMLNDGKYSLGGRLSEIRGFPVSPFRLLGDSPKIKRIHSPEFNEKKVIDLSKPDDETISGTKRKPSPEVSECSSQHGSERSKKKVKEEWSCAVCQVSATSERGLKDHLQGKKHQTKQAGLVAQITGANFGLGVEPKNPTIGIGSLRRISRRPLPIAGTSPSPPLLA